MNSIKSQKDLKYLNKYLVNSHLSSSIKDEFKLLNIYYLIEKYN